MTIKLNEKGKKIIAEFLRRSMSGPASLDAIYKSVEDEIDNGPFSIEKFCITVEREESVTGQKIELFMDPSWFDIE